MGTNGVSKQDTKGQTPMCHLCIRTFNYTFYLLFPHYYYYIIYHLYIKEVHNFFYWAWEHAWLAFEQREKSRANVTHWVSCIPHLYRADNRAFVHSRGRAKKKRETFFGPFADTLTRPANTPMPVRAYTNVKCSSMHLSTHRMLER